MVDVLRDMRLDVEKEGRTLTVLMIDVRRLIGMGLWCVTEGKWLSECLAAEEAVCAVRCDGRLIGRVGDFGRGFMNPVDSRDPGESFEEGVAGIGGCRSRCRYIVLLWGRIPILFRWGVVCVVDGLGDFGRVIWCRG